MAQPKAISFKARILREWVLYVVDVPRRISLALKAEGPTPVVLSVNGSSERKTTMTPRKTGLHRLHVHGQLRREKGVGEGDTVTIRLRRDTGPRGVEVPPDLAEALREADALEAFHALGPAHQRELVAWMDQAVRDETRSKRIVRVVERACAVREKRMDRS